VINISKLYCDEITPGDWLRYGSKDSAHRPGESVPAKASERRPIVVWNITRKCNLQCVHCYNDSGPDRTCNEISTAQAKAVIDDLACFGVPSILFSGGEPLMRHDLFELIEYAVGRGVRAVISTNGTLIDEKKAEQIKRLGVSYVGISLDGIGLVNDKFRGVPGAFERAVRGIRNCRQAGVRVGLRLTLTKRNVQELAGLFEFFEAEGIERVCFYHLVPSGRASLGPPTRKDALGDPVPARLDLSCEDARPTWSARDLDLTHAETRAALDRILAKAKQFKQAGRQTDILTVDNHVDGVYLYLKLLAEGSPRAAEVWKLLTWNGGGLYSSGVGIGCIDYNGNVHPDQFWWHYDLGNVRERPFSEIWTDPDEPRLKGLRDRRSHIKGRCKLCRFFDACGGSLRVRADACLGDPWAPDPACYLTDEEIAGLRIADCGLRIESTATLPESAIRNPKSEITPLDRRILEALQYDFPLSERPFDVLAGQLGLDAAVFWQRVEYMLDDGLIRRLGASFDSQKLGFSSTLAAVRVAPASVDRAAAIIGRYPEVTHSYLRDHEFNIWFTIIAADGKRIETILREVRDDLSLASSDVLNLPKKRTFKLDARFNAQR
jgi:radical SAM protein with 4Fe4S-binding SPASM domain